MSVVASTPTPAAPGAAPQLPRPPAIRLGAALGRARLWRRPLLLVLLLALFLAGGVSWVERLAAPHGAVDRALDFVFRLVIPLTSFAVVSLAVGRRRLSESVWSTARYGAPRRHLALGLLLAAAVAAGVIAMLAGWITVAVASTTLAGLGTDLVAASWIAALGAAAYVSWFGAGAELLRLGRGRWIPLVLDFLLGEGNGALAVPWPRAHLRNLIGGPPPLELPQSSSSVLLLGVTLVLLVFASARCGR